MGELVEYLVLTECGRRFAWSALGYEQLFRDMHERNYTVTFVMPYKEYEERERGLKPAA